MASFPTYTDRQDSNARNICDRENVKTIEIDVCACSPLPGCQLEFLVLSLSRQSAAREHTHIHTHITINIGATRRIEPTVFFFGVTFAHTHTHKLPRERKRSLLMHLHSFLIHFRALSFVASIPTTLSIFIRRAINLDCLNAKWYV